MIYFDNSATTQIDPTVLESYQIVSQKIWGNPSSLHKLGETAFNLLEQARQQIADLMKVNSDEIYFTSGGTEGDNWAVKGTAIEKQNYGKHIISTEIEHPAVLNSLKQLEKMGYEVTYLPVNEAGFVQVADVEKALRPDTILVSVMAVNNEIGSIQPIREIGDILQAYPKVHFHVDAVQAIGKGLAAVLQHERIDILTFSGHKFHAPRGSGFIYLKKGRKLAPLLSGGGQEKNYRSGTEHVAADVSLAKALRIILDQEQSKVEQQQVIKEKIYQHLKNKSKVTIFSDITSNYASHILCFAIQGVRGETIVHAFENHDIYISTTSACSSKKNIAAGTLKAMGVPEAIATSAVRVSLDEHNTLQEAEVFIDVFDELYEQFKKINS
ncbi:cysteine desulfurase family protein [Ligilactobacillus ceti]|uniref:Cysteine desulfurase selenocysteine lyase n=1 Tax=Ligilactobacillus ceti DSM 22408 TaxID=1122146 RepID=A0A0R2KRQ2_9LACO|nr:cysteine desulfurase family protein [Ligilactobacillus ceti]KRN88983.1 cysteine desulfurase selenocysteine lyase [Ligilactobacillus ceti DSM 22408]